MNYTIYSIYAVVGIHLKKMYMDIEHCTKLANEQACAQITRTSSEAVKKISSSSATDSMQAYSCSYIIYH